MIDCNEWRTEKRHECANMRKVKGLELWWQLYRTSLPVWDLEHFRPMDICWHKCTIISEVPLLHPSTPSLPSPPFAPPFLPYLVLMSAPSFPSAANSFRADVDNSSFRNVGKCVLHIRCCISDNSVIGRSVFQFFSDPTQDGRQCVDRGPVYVNEGNNYVVLFRTQPSQLWTKEWMN